MLILFSIQVVTEGRLILEFTFDDMMRIRSWHYAIRQHRELIPRNLIAMQAHVRFTDIFCDWAHHSKMKLPSLQAHS